MTLTIKDYVEQVDGLALEDVPPKVRKRVNEKLAELTGTEGGGQPQNDDAILVSKNLGGRSGFTEIQAAVDSAETGTTIFVEPGIYDKQVKIGKDDLTIVGVSRDDVVIRPSNFEEVTARGKETVTINPAVPADAGGDPSIIEESWWRSSRDHYEVSGVTLRNLTIDGGEAENRAGVYAAHAEDYTIKNVTIKNNGVLGTNGGVGSANGWCRNATFSDVELVDNGDGGMLAFRSDGFDIDGLSVENCGGDGVDIHGDNHVLTDVEVSGSGTNGIEFTQGGPNVLEDSEVYDNGTGIDIEKIGSDSITPTDGEIEVTVKSTDIYDNGVGLNIGDYGAHDELDVDARGNWWGSANGPNSEDGDMVSLPSGADPVVKLGEWLDAPTDDGDPVYGGQWTVPGTWSLDLNYDGVSKMEVSSVSDPVGSGSVTHVVSQGDDGGSVATGGPDYGLAAVEFDDPPSLGELAAGTTLTYQYYEGANNAGAAPDEIWLLIKDDAGERHVVWHTSNDDFTRDDSEKQADEAWLTRDVRAEIAGDPDTEDNPNYNWSEITADGIDSLGSADGTDLSEEFGDAAKLITVAIGRGGNSSTVADVYYKDLKLGDKTVEIPPSDLS